MPGLLQSATGASDPGDAVSRTQRSKIQMSHISQRGIPAKTPIIEVDEEYRARGWTSLTSTDSASGDLEEAQRAMSFNLMALSKILH